MYDSSNQQLKNNVKSIAEAVVIATMTDTDIGGYTRKSANAVSLLSVLSFFNPLKPRSIDHGDRRTTRYMYSISMEIQYGWAAVSQCHAEVERSGT